jgi:hypothetical protein
MRAPYIKEAFGEVVDVATAILQAKDPNYPKLNYIYDTVLQIDQRLEQEGNGGGAGKYPLIALVQPFKERKGYIPGLAGEISPIILIAYWTNQNLTSPQRDEQVFKPFLYPAYEAFMLALSRSKYWSAPVSTIQHTKTDFPFYGGQSGRQDKSAFTEQLDIIQLEFTNLKTYLTC